MRARGLRRRRLGRAAFSSDRRRLPRPGQEDGNRPGALDRGTLRSGVLHRECGTRRRRARPSARTRRADRRRAAGARDRFFLDRTTRSPRRRHVAGKSAQRYARTAQCPGTFAATTHDCKRVAKEADSAWLRFGPEPQRFDVASDPRTLQPNTVLLWSDAGIESARSIADTLAVFSEFRGHLALDESSGAATPAQLAAAIGRWRTAILNRR